MWPLLLACIVAGCTSATSAVFQVDGQNTVLTERRGSVVALWTLTATPDIAYKFGDGVLADAQFSISWEADPPPGALNPDGIGVATLVLVPPATTVPDGEIARSQLAILGATANTAVIYKSGAGGPAWAATFAPRFSCAACVRSADLDTFELRACADVMLEPAGRRPCAWYQVGLVRPAP